MTDRQTNRQQTDAPDDLVSFEDRVYVGRRMLTGSMIGLVVLAIIGLAVGWSVHLWLTSRDKSGAPLPPARRDSENPGYAASLRPQQRIDRERYEAEQRDLLSRYEWIDRERGIARIPIDRAIEVLQSQKQESK